MYVLSHSPCSFLHYGPSYPDLASQLLFFGAVIKAVRGGLRTRALVPRSPHNRFCLRFLASKVSLRCEINLRVCGTRLRKLALQLAANH